MYLFLYFLKFVISIFIWRITLEISVLLCALMCLSSVNIISIYTLISLFAFASNVLFFYLHVYNILPNKLNQSINQLM